MRPHGIVFLLALGAGHVAAQEEDEGIEISEPEKPEKPRTIEQAIEEGLADLRSYVPEGNPRIEGLVLHTRAVCGDLRKEDRERLTALHDDWKRDSQHETFASPVDLAALVLALAAANADSKAKPPAPSENPNRPPRGSRFDKDHWKLMHECIVRMTTQRLLCQNSDGGWGVDGSRLATTHFALLALRAAARAGYPVEPKAFHDALRYLKKEGAALGPDTADQAMGMVSVWICREQLALLADAKYPVPEWSRELAERTALLANVFRDPAVAPTIECLWAMEQLGSLTGQAQLGGRDWYREGTNRALAAKWLAKDKKTREEVLSTCFALLFLKRQTPPLAAGK